jgi:hypothetical protein
MVNDLLPQMPGRGQLQRKCLAPLFVTILVLRGHVTFRTLRRSGDSAARPMARQWRQPFDWLDFLQRVRLRARAPDAALVSAHDASVLPQRGKETSRVGHFCNGWARRAARRREIATLTVVAVTRRCAFPLAVAQTPPGEDATKAAPEATRVACETQLLPAPRHRLPPSMP